MSVSPDADEIPKDKIDLYLKVSALAERGAAGEKEQAERTLARLRLRYPGIEFIAEERIREEQRATRRGRAEPPPPNRTPKEAFWSTYTKTFESVSKLLSEIGDILGDVSQEAEAKAAIDEAIEASYRTVKVKGSEKFRLMVDIDTATLEDVLASLEGDERAIEGIATHIGSQVAEALSAAFLGDADADEDEDE